MTELLQRSPHSTDSIKLAQILARMDGDGQRAALPYLLAVLSGQEPHRQPEALTIMKCMDLTAAKEALPPLIGILRRNDPTLSHAGRRVLGRIGPEARPAIPACSRL